MLLISTKGKEKKREEALVENRILELIFKEGMKKYSEIEDAFNKNPEIYPNKSSSRINTVLHNLSNIGENDQPMLELIKVENIKSGNSVKFYAITDKGIEHIMKNCAERITIDDLWQNVIRKCKTDYQNITIVSKKYKSLYNIANSFNSITIEEMKKRVEKKVVEVVDETRQVTKKKTIHQWMIKIPRKYFKITTDKMFSLFEEHHYKISPEHFNSLVGTRTLDIIGEICQDEEFYNKIKPIIKIITEDGITNREMICSKMNEMSYLSNSENRDLISQMSIRGLIFFSHDLKTVKLSPFGIILSFFIIFEEIALSTDDKKIKLHDGKLNIDFSTRLNKIIDKNQNQLPLILSKWKILRNILGKGDLGLLDCLCMPYLHSKKIDRTYNQGSELLCFTLQNQMEVKYKEIMQKEYDKGLEVIMKLADEKGYSQYLFDNDMWFRNRPSPVIRMISNNNKVTPRNRLEVFEDGVNIVDQKLKKEIIDFFDDMSEPLVKFGELDHIVNNFQTSDFLMDFTNGNVKEEKIKSVENIVTFYFYNWFRFEISQEGDSKKYERMIKFFNSDEDVRPWYNEWLKLLTNFQNNNINEINKLRINVILH